MARLQWRRLENVPGDFFVDETCIDCDLCRQIAPHTFRQIGDMSAVYQQPDTAEKIFAAMKALVTCPTASIGTTQPYASAEAVQAYPERIEDNVYFCGFASQNSYGAASYLIVRPEGNILVDSPRYAKPLQRKIQELGGVDLIFLTHRDDVADHHLWAKHLGARRIMHCADAGELTYVIETLLTGEEAIPIASDLIAIPTPGHTRGHMVLLYKKRFLFTGDHLHWSPRYKSLNASPGVCWYSWWEQLNSVKKLLAYSFEWVLPGHGRRAKAPVEEMHRQLRECLHRYWPLNSVSG